MKSAFIILGIICAILMEIATFIFVGSYIGIIPTLAFVLFSMFLGLYLLRHQGNVILQSIVKKMQYGQEINSEITTGTRLFFCAILFIIPGFFSDLIALLLMIKPIGQTIEALFFKINPKARFYNNNYQTNHKKQDDSTPKVIQSEIINLDIDEYHVLDNSLDPETSPWRQQSGKEPKNKL